MPRPHSDYEARCSRCEITPKCTPKSKFVDVITFCPQRNAATEAGSEPTTLSSEQCHSQWPTAAGRAKYGYNFRFM